LLEARGYLLATGGEGGPRADRTGTNIGASGALANRSTHRGDTATNHSRPKTDGGDGGDGGNGGAGGLGGFGGEGGAGSGGTIRLQGASVITEGGAISVSGGSAGGGNGRVLISEAGEETFAMVNLGGSLEEFPGLTAPNPHWNTRGATPLITGLKGGAEVGGLLNGANAGTFPQVVQGAPTGSALALHRQASFNGDAYPGYDWLFLVNLTAGEISAPVLGMGEDGYLHRLVDGGLTAQASFGGEGPGTRASLPAFEVYATLIPNEVTQMNFGFVNGGLYLEEQSSGMTTYLGENAPAVGVIPDPVTEDFSIPGYPTDGDQIERVIRGEVSVIIEPAEAIAAGARWQLESVSGTFKSGEAVENVPLGNQEISFPPIEGWIPPTAVSLNVLPDGLISTATVTFTEASSGTIGAVPPLTVSRGGAIGLSFPAGTTLDVISGNPNDSLFINQNGWFYYDSGDDRTPFEVRFSRGGVSQTVLITPEPELPPEEEIIALLPQPDSLPDASGFDYNHIHSLPGTATMHFADDNSSTRVVTLSGKQIIFSNEEDGTGRMFKEVNGPSQFIEELRIYAEEVIFVDALHVP
jgi:hypothetical protein